MTREELLLNEANGYAFDLDCGDLNTNRDTFIAGAEWADSHPRKGLVDIKKVSIWLIDFFRNIMSKTMQKVLKLVMILF